MGACCMKSSDVSFSHSKRQRPLLAPLRLTPDGIPPDGVDDSIPAIPNEKLRELVSIQLYDDPSPPKCPYCERPDSDKADMMICNSEIFPYTTFETLMERGWWRTGNVIFMPQSEVICCPSFAIRMPAAEYQFTKNHRALLNKWKNFLLNGDPRWENRTTIDNSPLETGPKPSNDTPNNDILNEEPLPTLYEDTIHPENCKPKKSVRSGLGPDPSKPLCKKARQRRVERALDKRSRQKDSTEKQSTSLKSKKTLLEVLREHDSELETSTPKHKLEIKLIARDDPEIKSSLKDFFDLYNRFQDAVHPGKSKFNTAADLHWGFINSPLQPSQGDRPLGTYHMRYYLDGELTMLSVIDILPRYLVSIYFIYNPQIRFLQPGIYTCLREIALIQELQQKHPELIYYNLGFFNNFSPKISYKKQFKPTEILCPVTNTYVPLERVIPLLKETRFCRFADEDAPDRLKESDYDVDQIIVLDVTAMKGRYLKDLPQVLRPSYKTVLQHYMRGAGEDVLSKMLISR